jgi:hypothetical protein
MIRNLLIDAIAECEAMRARLPGDTREEMDELVRQICVALGCAAQIYSRNVLPAPERLAMS